MTRIGSVYFDLKDKQKALSYYCDALPLARAVGDKRAEASTLHSLMLLWDSLGKRRMAIFMGKLAIMTFQQVRNENQDLSSELQRSLLYNLENSYRSLAELLIEEGQFEQAIEVLNLYRDEEFLDFHFQLGNPARLPSMSPREQRFAQQYSAGVQDVGETGSRLQELNRRIGKAQASETEAAEIRAIEKELTAATKKFLSGMDDAAREFGQPRDQQDVLAPISEVRSFQDTLQTLIRETNQNTVALYTLMGTDKFHLLLLSSDEIKAFSTPIKSDDLNYKVRQFSALLQSNDYDPSLLGKELYDIIVKPAEAELQKRKVQTLMWSLDGTLRYVPTAALHDGTRYLVERFNHVNFTRGNQNQLTRFVSPTWTGYGFANSIGRKIQLFGSTIDFGPIDFVKEEMQFFRTKAYPQGIIDGDVIFDGRFTKATLLANLKQRRPLVHISSHFRFRPGDATNSFLLLGDGNVMTLAEISDQQNLFQDVELLTLSACDTASQRPNADGKEIDTFAELAQRLGASSVMASLWSVLDRSTADLMKAFYKNRQSGKYTKSEALRQAQLDLIFGRNMPVRIPTDAKSIGSTKGDNSSNETEFVEPKYRIPSKIDKNRPFAHPYYWSAFVLFGNWK